MNNPAKTKAWDWLLDARREAEAFLKEEASLAIDKKDLILKQLHILEGSDWFWWAGEDPDGSFDRLYRMHLGNLYRLLGKEPPKYLEKPC